MQQLFGPGKHRFGYRVTMHDRQASGFIIDPLEPRRLLAQTAAVAIADTSPVPVDGWDFPLGSSPDTLEDGSVIEPRGYDQAGIPTSMPQFPYGPYEEFNDVFPASKPAGTGAELERSTRGRVVRPKKASASYYIEQDVGSFYTGYGVHTGEDWNKIQNGNSVDPGDTVYAAANGQVAAIVPAHSKLSPDAIGWLIVLAHWSPGNTSPKATPNFYTFYEHVTFLKNSDGTNNAGGKDFSLARGDFGIEKGDYIERGQPIAQIGAVTKLGAHLHFELREWTGINFSDLDKDRTLLFNENAPFQYFVSRKGDKGNPISAIYARMKTAGIRDPSDFINLNRPDSNNFLTVLSTPGVQYTIDLTGPDHWAGFFLPKDAILPSVTLQPPSGESLGFGMYDADNELIAGLNTLPGQQATFDLSGHPAGPYFVKVSRRGPLAGARRAPTSATLAFAQVKAATGTDVEVVVDVSLSMDENVPGSAPSESKLTAAKRAAGRFANLMGNGDRIGVVGFSGSAFSVFDLALIEPTNTSRADAIAAIDALSSLPTGTGIGYGIAAGGDQLDRFPNDKHRAIILLTDGQENQGPDSLDIVNQLPADVRVFTIGFGSDVDATRLAALAGARSGNFFNAATAAELQAIYRNLLGLAAGQQAFSNLSLAINPGGTTTTTVNIDQSTTAATFGITWPGSNLELTLTTPTGQVISQNTVGAFPGIELVRDETSAFYRVDAPDAGLWQVGVLGVEVPRDHYPFSFFTLGESPIAADVSLDATGYAPGQPIAIRLDFNEGTPITGGTVVAHLTPPTDGAGSPASFELPLYDDGLHGDDLAADGVYGNTFTQAFLTGTYGLTVNADGASALGFAVSRAPTTSFVVSSGNGPALFAGDVTITQPLTGNGTVSFPITLSEPLGFDISVDYATFDGTAAAGLDYAAASGTVTIPAGQQIVTVPVQVVGTVLSSATKAFSLSLQNSAGAPIGRATASATLLPTGLTTVSSTKGRATYTDAAGRAVIVQLAGPGDVQLAFPAGSTGGNPAAIVVTGSTNRSILLVRALGGFTTLGGISVNGSLGALIAPAVNLLGGVSISGAVTRLLLHDVTGPGSLNLGGGNPVISLGTADNFDIVSASPIRAIVASQWLNSDSAPHGITAPSIGTLLVNGPMGADISLTGGGMDLRAALFKSTLFDGTWNIAGSVGAVLARGSSNSWSANVTGDIASLSFSGSMAGSVTARSIRTLRTGTDLYFATIRLNSTSTAINAPALGTLLVGGTIDNSRITSAGSVRAVLAGGMVNSSLTAGVSDAVTTLPVSAADFVNVASIATFAIRPRGLFSNSYIAAAKVGNVLLGNVQTQNAGTAFGLATQSLGAITASSPKLRWFNRLDPLALRALPDDFKVSLI